MHVKFFGQNEWTLNGALLTFTHAPHKIMSQSPPLPPPPLGIVVHFRVRARARAASTTRGRRLSRQAAGNTGTPRMKAAPARSAQPKLSRKAAEAVAATTTTTRPPPPPETTAITTEAEAAQRVSAAQEASAAASVVAAGGGSGGCSKNKSIYSEAASAPCIAARTTAARAGLKRSVSRRSAHINKEGQQRTGESMRSAERMAAGRVRERGCHSSSTVTTACKAGAATSGGTGAGYTRGDDWGAGGGRRVAVAALLPPAESTGAFAEKSSAVQAVELAQKEQAWIR